MYLTPGYISLLSFIKKYTFISVSEASCSEKQLLNDLFKDYDKDMRPVLNDSDTVTVTIGLSLHQIMDVVSNITKVYRWVNIIFMISNTVYLCLYLFRRMKETKL